MAYSKTDKKTVSSLTAEKRAEKGPTPPSTYQAYQVVELMLVHQVSFEQMEELMKKVAELLNETHRQLTEE